MKAFFGTIAQLVFGVCAIGEGLILLNIGPTDIIVAAAKWIAARPNIELAVLVVAAIGLIITLRDVFRPNSPA